MEPAPPLHTGSSFSAQPQIHEQKETEMTYPSTVARKMWSTSEPFVATGLICKESLISITELGVPKGAAFFAVRGAPMGAANTAIFAAAFHGFALERLQDGLTAAWEVTSPATVIESTHAAIPVMAQRVFADSQNLQEITEVGELLATLVSNLDVSGRPLAAGNKAVISPDEPWAKLWRAWNALREYRGDAHVATLVANNLTVDEAQVLSATWGAAKYDVDLLRTTRGLDDSRWELAQTQLQDRGLLNADGSISPLGAQMRDDIELRTDQSCMNAWNQLSATDLEAVRTCTYKLSAHIIDAGLFPVRSAVGAPWPPSE